MEPRWYESAVAQLERDLDAGHITQAEFNKEMRDLNRELRDAADEYAEGARRDYLGEW